MKPIIQLIPKTPQAQANIENIANDMRMILTAFDVTVVNLVSANLTPVSENVEARTALCCECEDGSHFGGHPEMNHAYTAEVIDPVFIETVKTPYGTFRLCKDCRRSNHMEAK